MRAASARSRLAAALAIAFLGLWTAAAQSTQSSDRLKLNFEIRGRMDGFRNAKAMDGTDQAFYLHRVRLTSTMRFTPWLRATAQFQDSRVAGYPLNPAPATVSNSADLRQAYLELGGGETGWNLRAGRQPLVFGDMRLVSTSNWGNVGPNYDGARLAFKTARVQMDWFSTAVVTPRPGFDRPRGERKLHGFYSSFRPGRGVSAADFYLFWKDNQRGANLAGQVGTHDLGIAGARLTGKLAAQWDYNMELALQRGRLSGDRIAAWAGHWETGYTAGVPRLSFEYDYATGDDDPGDGRHRSFDQPYATNVYGTATDFGWRNIHQISTCAAWSPKSAWKMRTCYRSFWLATTRDSLYTVTGAVFLRNPQATDAHVGDEADVRVIWQLTRQLQLWGGYAHLVPGGFLRESGRRSAVLYPYVMWTLTL